MNKILTGDCGSSPLVSVIMVTFNHELYVSEAIEGVLSQKTNFPFELIIADDASGDRTPEIIQRFHQNAPDIIRPLLREVNLGPMKNWIKAWEDSKGKYIAICEGDDYWKDPCKLQREVDFLEKDSRYTLVCTDYDVLNEAGNDLKTNVIQSEYSLRHDTDIVFSDYIINRFKVRTLTVMFRSQDLHSYFKEIDQSISAGSIIGDLPLWLFLLSRGDGRFIAESTAVYRLSANSASRQAGPVNRYEYRKSVNKILGYYIKGSKLSGRYHRWFMRQTVMCEIEYNSAIVNRRKLIAGFLNLFRYGLPGKVAIRLLFKGIF